MAAMKYQPAGRRESVINGGISVASASTMAASGVAHFFPAALCAITLAPLSLLTLPLLCAYMVSRRLPHYSAAHLFCALRCTALRTLLHAQASAASGAFRQRIARVAQRWAQPAAPGESVKSEKKLVAEGGISVSVA